MAGRRDKAAELQALLARLAEAEAEVQAHLEGEVDAVVMPRGAQYLLADAQRALVSTEARSREHAALLEALLTSAPDYITHVGLDGIIVFVNRGRSPSYRDKVVGTAWLSYMPAAHREQLRTVFDEVVRLGEVRDYESEGDGPTGERAWFLRRLAPLRRDEKVIGVVIVTRDVTERHRLEQETREARALAESIFATLHDPFVVVDDALRITTVNDAFARLFELPKESVTGKPLFDVMAAGGWSETALPALLVDVLADRLELTDHDLELDVPSSERRRFLVDARRVRRGDGAVVLLVLGLRDVTDRDERIRLVERQRQLERSNQELDAFAHSVSHDLRAPARAVGGFAKALLEDHGASLAPEAMRLVTRIASNAERMGRMVGALLAFARSAGTTPTLRTVDMRALVAALVDEKLTLTKDRTIDVELGELPTVSCDPDLLRLVWANLLSNAIKYTSGRDEARIRIDGSVDGAEVSYVIEDNGAGFDMQSVGRLFGMFQRLHTDSEFEGTGVGLSIVRRIVAGHGGRVWGKGVPGVGATFGFTLPKVPPASSG